MLEVRYNTQTKEVTGWWGNRHGNTRWVRNPIDFGYSEEEIESLETRQEWDDELGEEITLYEIEGLKLRDRPDEVLVLLDIPIPGKRPEAWLCDGKTLVPNPDYVEPEPLRDLQSEIDSMRLELDMLQNK